MLSKTYGSAVYGVEAVTITVEVSVYPGALSYIVGLPDSAVKESLQRVEAAIKNNNYFMPAQDHHQSCAGRHPQERQRL